MRAAIFQVVVNGQDISSAIEPCLTSISITDGSGGKTGGQTDGAEIELDDASGRILLPPRGAPITIALGWDDTGAVTAFGGIVDNVRAQGARGGGRMLSITAKSADMGGKLKERQEKHKDDAKLGDVAQEWGKAAGVEVTVDPSLASIERDYWAMDSESFPEWGRRTAGEIGATFKIRGGKAVMVPRSGGASPSGQTLPSVTATFPGNGIAYSMSPDIGDHKWEEFEVGHYDRKSAKYRSEIVQAEKISGKTPPAKARHRHHHRAADAETAKRHAGSHGAEADREGAGGSVIIDGEPTAQAEAN